MNKIDLELEKLTDRQAKSVLCYLVGRFEYKAQNNSEVTSKEVFEIIKNQIEKENIK